VSAHGIDRRRRGERRREARHERRWESTGSVESSSDGEERTLFETAQQVLDPAVLAELGELHEAAARPACSTTARKRGVQGAS